MNHCPTCGIEIPEWKTYCSRYCCNTSPEHRKISSDNCKRWNSSPEGKAMNREKMISYNKSEEHRNKVSEMMIQFHKDNPSFSEIQMIHMNSGRLYDLLKDKGEVYIYLLKCSKYNLMKLGACGDLNKRLDDIKYWGIDISDSEYWIGSPRIIVDLEKSLKLRYYEVRTRPSVDLNNVIGYTEYYPIKYYDEFKKVIIDTLSNQ